jgi:Protein of unknown function (DUF3500)
MTTYKGFGPRPELLPLREGVVDFSIVTPEMADHLAAVTRNYPLPPVEENAHTPFVGITMDGRPIPGLFALEDTGLDPRPLVSAADEFLAALNAPQRAAARQPIDSAAWRMWTNAFPAWVPHGLRLQDLERDTLAATLAVIEATLSNHGYGLTRDVMRLNGELGRLLNQYDDTLTEWMYWFSLFGEPSATEPWGWQLYGHHLDLNCLILGRQLVLSPTFMGAEFRADALFAGERTIALELVNALSPGQLDAARVHERFADLPADLQGPVDGRHRGGAGQDNRIVPYEGITATTFTPPQRELFHRLLQEWIGRMPAGPAAARTRELTRHLETTHFAWYGPTEGDEAFYYRVQSPVALIEYDNHPGIFLDNEDPQPFHVHTVVRTPNGNDYGRDILRQHLESHGHDHGSHQPHVHGDSGRGESPAPERP